MSTNLGISATLSESELHQDALKQSKYLYIEGYLTTSPLGHQAASKQSLSPNSMVSKLRLHFLIQQSFPSSKHNF